MSRCSTQPCPPVLLCHPTLGTTSSLLKVPFNAVVKATGHQQVETEHFSPQCTSYLIIFSGLAPGPGCGSACFVYCSNLHVLRFTKKSFTLLMFYMHIDNLTLRLFLHHIRHNTKHVNENQEGVNGNDRQLVQGDLNRVQFQQVMDDFSSKRIIHVMYSYLCPHPKPRFSKIMTSQVIGVHNDIAHKHKSSLECEHAKKLPEKTIFAALVYCLYGQVNLEQILLCKITLQV